MQTDFKIGEAKISVISGAAFPFDKDVSLFADETCSGEDAEITYELKFVKEFAPVWGNILHRNYGMIIMDVDGTENRIHLLPANGQPFAITVCEDEYRRTVYIDEKAVPVLKWDRNLLGLMMLERDVLMSDSFLLHASYIIYEGQAIVFTAPSGTGKSTQADLWAKHAGAKVINGDRTLLIKKDGRWYAGGFPVCGSSPYCLNETAPLKAVICLEKAPVNNAVKMGAIESIKAVYSQSFVNNWSSRDCDKTASLIADLADNVEIYKYSCTKEEDAVSFLKGVLGL